MFSYVDLVRCEIAIYAEKRFGAAIPDADQDGWRTLGDVARSVASRTKATDADVFNWVRRLMIVHFRVSMAFTPESDVFSDYDRVTRWFFSSKGDVPKELITPPGPDDTFSGVY